MRTHGIGTDVHIRDLYGIECGDGTRNDSPFVSNSVADR